MKKLLGILALLAVAGAFVGTGYYLWKKSQKAPVVWPVESPKRGNVISKAVATGSVVPRKEVEIKPMIAGILSQLHVEAGALVKAGDVVATVAVVPDMVNLSNAESRLNRARIALADAERELLRQRGLREDGVIPDSVLQQYETGFAAAREELDGAQDLVDLVRKGTARRSGSTTSTLVRATISGTVLAVPREAGNSVIPSNNFNDGSTIVTIADMDDLIFKGKVDESEVGKLKPGMALLLRIGALEGKTFDATLEHIAPKGFDESGAIKFEIRAAIQKPVDPAIRANLSANADIVLARRDDVLTLDESALQFDKGKPFVEVETAPQTFEKRPVETGLSDGLKIEIVSGLSETEKVKNPARGPQR